MSSLSSASASGSGTRFLKSRLLIGLAGAGAAAGILYFGYLKPKADKRQEELNKRFEKPSFAGDDVDRKNVGTKSLAQLEKEGIDEHHQADTKIDKSKDSNAKDLLETAEDDCAQKRGTARDVIIPREFVSSFIGKNGTYIRQLQSETNTRIVNKATLDNGDRVFAINGLADDVVLAEHQIKRFIALQPVQITSEVLVPNEYVGAVIGNKGENIRSIQDKSRAKITVDPQQDPEIAFFAPSTSVARTCTPVLIRGTEEQIKIAKELIDEIIIKKRKVDENRKVRVSAAGDRTNRRVISPSAELPDSTNAVPAVSSQGEKSKLDLEIQTGNTFDVFVSCVFDPNSFYIQVVKAGATRKLDELTEEMTEYYTYAKTNKEQKSGIKFKVGDTVAAPFDIDKKIYRAEIVSVEEDSDEVQIRYVDYGDKRTLRTKDLRPMKSEFLRLRFQALEATINMEVPEGGWTSEIIDEFCNLTYCGNWTIIKAKRVEYISSGSIDDAKICVDLFVNYRKKTLNVKEELARFINSLKPKYSALDSKKEILISSTTSETNSEKEFATSVNNEKETEPSVPEQLKENDHISPEQSNTDKKNSPEASESLITNSSPTSPETSESFAATSSSAESSVTSPEQPSNNNDTSNVPFSYAAMAKKHSS